MRKNVEFINSLNKMRDEFDSMSKTQKKIASYILKNPSVVLKNTLNSMANLIGVSEGSIINFSVFLGFEGYSALKINIAQGIRPVSTVVADNTDVNGDAKVVLKNVMENISMSFQATYDIISEGQIERAADMLLSAKRIEIFGVTSSAIIADDAYYRMMKLGLPVKSVTDSLICVTSALMLSEGDVLLTISASGKTHDLVRAISVAKEQGASVISITGNADSPIAKACDLILLTGNTDMAVNNFSQNLRIVQMFLIEALCQFIAIRTKDKVAEYQQKIDKIWLEYYQN